MIKNKKARVTVYTWMWVITILFILIPFYVGIRFIVGAALESSLSTGDLESHILFNRVFYSKNSVFYTNELTKRHYTNIVDIDKFNEQVLKDLFNETKLQISFKLTLEPESQPPTEIFYNQKLYESIEPRLINKNYDSITQSILVTIKDEDTYTKGKLIVTAHFQK
ncbi:MAG: hypothetical protein QF824_03775 [Candidatus Woesearchaeota archaeon]|jgi:hypothetical protein|nr:hypothetical protein [Candidatus Woesearchaeota archaeon]